MNDIFRVLEALEIEYEKFWHPPCHAGRGSAVSKARLKETGPIEEYERFERPSKRSV